MPDTFPNGYTLEQMVVIMFEDIKAIKKTINGNGRPGLVDDVAHLEERFEGHIKISDRYIEEFDNMRFSQREKQVVRSGAAAGVVGFVMSVIAIVREMGVFS